MLSAIHDFIRLKLLDVLCLAFENFGFRMSKCTPKRVHVLEYFAACDTRADCTDPEYFMCLWGVCKRKSSGHRCMGNIRARVRPPNCLGLCVQPAAALEGHTWR
jgi:hypothetical protein